MQQKKADGVAVRFERRREPGRRRGESVSLLERSTERHRNEDPRVVALDEQGDRLARLVDRALQLLDAFYRSVVDRDDHVARTHARALCRAGDVLNDQSVVEIGAALLVGAQRTYGNTQLGLAE